MAKELGTKVLLFVRPTGGSPPGTYYWVRGQRDTAIDLSRAAIDSSDKSTLDWATSIGGLKSGNITCSGLADWTDTNGLLVVKAAFDNSVDVEAYIALNSSGLGYKGTFSATSLGPLAGSYNDITNYAISLTPTSAPVAVASATINTTLGTADAG